MEPIKVTKEHVDAIVAGLTFDHHHYPGTNYVVAIAKDAFGYVHAHGFSSCVDPDAFDLQMGIDIAVRNAKSAAISAIWEKESYKLLPVVQQKHITRTQISLDLGENHPDPQGAIEGVAANWDVELRWPKPDQAPVQVTVLSDGSTVSSQTPADIARGITESFANVRAHGAPVVSDEAELQSREGMISRYRRVWPWWRSDRNNDLFNPAVRPARGGMTAPLRVSSRGGMNLKELCGTEQSVFVECIDRIYVAVGDMWFSFSVASKAPGNRVYIDGRDPHKQRLSIHIPAGISTGTELHTPTGIVSADLGKDSISFVVSMEIASNAVDGRLVVIGYINDVHVKNNSDGWNPQGKFVEDLVKQLKDGTASSVVAIDLHTSILDNTASIDTQESIQ